MLRHPKDAHDRVKALGTGGETKLKNKGKAGVRIEAQEIDINYINKQALEKVGLKAELQGRFNPRKA